MSDTLNIKCGHMVSVSGGFGIQHNIIFKPTKATAKALANYPTGLVKIAVKDVSGDHVSNRYHRIVGLKSSHGTITLTTQEV